MKTGINLQGRKGNIVIDYVSTAGKCARHCEDDENCNYWVWHVSTAGMYAYKCALVESYSNEASDPNSVTGSKDCQVSENENCLIEDSNLQGRIGSEKTTGVSSWGECALLCKERGSCKAWVWHSESTGVYADICVTVEGFTGVAPNSGVMVGFQSCQDEAPSTTKPAPPLPTDSTTTTTEPAPPLPTDPTTTKTPPTPAPTDLTTIQTPSTPAPTDPTTTVREILHEYSPFEKKCLEVHNKYRATHQAPALQLDPKLCKDAKDWAIRMTNIGMKHSDVGGENLYMSWSGGEVDEEALGEDSTKAWYDEVKDYSYSNPGFSSATGHFTQVVWKASEKLGCGYAVDGSNVYVVARYTPVGNYMGQFPDNVLPPK